MCNLSFVYKYTFYLYTTFLIFTVLMAFFESTKKSIKLILMLLKLLKRHLEFFFTEMCALEASIHRFMHFCTCFILILNQFYIVLRKGNDEVIISACNPVTIISENFYKIYIQMSFQYSKFRDINLEQIFIKQRDRFMKQIRINKTENNKNIPWEFHVIYIIITFVVFYGKR